MDFTYLSYIDMLNRLKKNDYKFSSYKDNFDTNKYVILRHDIDFTLDKALEMAKIEYENEVCATYFILLCTDFYNVFSKRSKNILLELKALGHNIGLHFDETKYGIVNDEKIFKDKIFNEISILENALNTKINIVSMHRPSKWILDKNIILGGRVINTYSNRFFKEFKYVSDSRMNWRENIISIIESNKYNKLHILTHPIWYQDNQIEMKAILINFIKQQQENIYNYLDDNITNLGEVFKFQEIK